MVGLRQSVLAELNVDDRDDIIEDNDPPVLIDGDQPLATVHEQNWWPYPVGFQPSINGFRWKHIGGC